jgi:predicted DNA-binding protein (MmcQ/YjbR family)
VAIDNKNQASASESQTSPIPARSGIDELRQICLALPEVTEVEAWGDPTFRVRNKIFATHKIGDGRSSLWCKAQPGDQSILVSAAPEKFYVPPYVGHHGWIGVRLDGEVDWDEVAALVETSYRLTAPRRLAARLG